MDDKRDFGEVQGLKIDVLSETGWFDDATFKQTMMDYGGTEQSQYRIPWSWDNAGGYSALITVTLLDGDEKKILLDTGWNTEWMDTVYERRGIPEMLERGEIDFMVLSHWHLDHFWGIESTLKHNPGLTIYAPRTWHGEDRALLEEKAHLAVDDHDGRSVAICKNDVRHEGALILTGPEGAEGDGLYRPLPGLAIHMFDVPILLQVQAENVLYFNVKDKGVVTVTGCGHPGVMNLLDYARENFRDNRLYGCYGGLHLSIFDTWKPEFDDIIEEVRDSGMTKMGCNHCTGWMWAEKAASHGVPIVKGTDTYMSYPKRSTAARGSNAFLGNGDSVSF
jgi:7,8-dihydropterin-6-yl-methyl-4-(beta-D-ribofuranosyl)aminobenzene 5'-phosphate synthase